MLHNKNLSIRNNIESVGYRVIYFCSSVFLYKIQGQNFTHFLEMSFCNNLCLEFISSSGNSYKW